MPKKVTYRSFSTNNPIEFTFHPMEYSGVEGYALELEDCYGWYPVIPPEGKNADIIKQLAHVYLPNYEYKY